MTRLLVSVRDADEALDALAGGTDLIDIKEPNVGSLGAAAPEMIRQIIQAVAGRCPVSVALGELVDISEEDFSYCVGATYAKVGLAGTQQDPLWPARWKEVIERLPKGVHPVAVLYADYATAAAPAPDLLLAHARSLDCAAVLIDTFDKSLGRLTQQWTIRELEELAARVRQMNMLFVVAGSLAATDLPMIEPLAADYIAVRSAVCESQRTGRLMCQLVEQLSAEIKGQSRGVNCSEKGLQKDTQQFA
jgi:uncharacterized protein (UPF0264 family)